MQHDYKLLHRLVANLSPEEIANLYRQLYRQLLPAYRWGDLQLLCEKFVRMEALEKLRPSSCSDSLIFGFELRGEAHLAILWLDDNVDTYLPETGYVFRLRESEPPEPIEEWSPYIQGVKEHYAGGRTRCEE